MSDPKDIDLNHDGQIHFDESGLSDDVERLDALHSRMDVDLKNLWNLAATMKRALEDQKRINYHLKNHLDTIQSFQQELLDRLTTTLPLGHPLQELGLNMSQRLRRLQSDAMREAFLKVDRHRAPGRHEELLREVERQEAWKTQEGEKLEDHLRQEDEKMKARIRRAFDWVPPGHRK